MLHIPCRQVTKRHVTEIHPLRWSQFFSYLTELSGCQSIFDSLFFGTNKHLHDFCITCQRRICASGHLIGLSKCSKGANLLHQRRTCYVPNLVKTQRPFLQILYDTYMRHFTENGTKLTLLLRYEQTNN